jgi:hypothetical protein
VQPWRNAADRRMSSENAGRWRLRHSDADFDGARVFNTLLGSFVSFSIFVKVSIS